MEIFFFIFDFFFLRRNCEIAKIAPVCDCRYSMLELDSDKVSM